MYDAVIVGCGGSKLPHLAPAKDLYTSTLFRKSRAWAEQNGRAWYIASAKHGLLEPDAIIAPYDVRLGGGRGAPPIHDWTATVVDALMERLAWSVTPRVAILAGKVYVDTVRRSLVSLGVTVDDPLAGLGIGDRLGWLTREAAA